MRVAINTYSIVVKSITYLEQELVKRSLNKEIAILYFQILLDQEKDNLIERPHFTYALNGFDKYLKFFKQFNFIYTSLKRNSFWLSKNWKDTRELYTVPFPIQEIFLEMSKQVEELNYFYRISA